MKNNNIRKMSLADMQEFVNLIEKGKGASGAVNQKLKAFNNAIRKIVINPSGKQSINQILALGQKYWKSGRFRLLAAGAVLSAGLCEGVADSVEVLNVMAKSGHYRLALQALEDGDLTRAQRLLVGDDRSLYSEVLFKVGALAALNLRRGIYQMFEDATKRPYD